MVEKELTSSIGFLKQELQSNIFAMVDRCAYLANQYYKGIQTSSDIDKEVIPTAAIAALDDYIKAFWSTWQHLQTLEALQRGAVAAERFQKHVAKRTKQQKARKQRTKK